SSSQCNTGTIHCCDSTEPASSPLGQTILGALNFDVPTDTSVGMKCSPIDTGDLGGDQSCTASPVCCSGGNYGGIALSCMPI
ncbi:hypothetical protein C8T65DRAFT_562708, partial [Cerioporus squamosus]